MSATDPTGPRLTILQRVRQVFKTGKPLLSAMVMLDMFRMEINAT